MKNAVGRLLCVTTEFPFLIACLDQQTLPRFKLLFTGYYHWDKIVVIKPDHDVPLCRKNNICTFLQEIPICSVDMGSHQVTIWFNSWKNRNFQLKQFSFKTSTLCDISQSILNNNKMHLLLRSNSAIIIFLKISMFLMCHRNWNCNIWDFLGSEMTWNMRRSIYLTSVNCNERDIAIT